MNHKDLTALDVAGFANTFNHPEQAKISKMVLSFLRERPARDIETFLQNSMPQSGEGTWISKAKVALDIRLAEDAAGTADKLVLQTDRLVKFTKFLLWFTVALFICGLIQIGLMMFENWLAKQL